MSVPMTGSPSGRTPHRVWWRSSPGEIRLLASILLAFSPAGCDESFVAFEENDPVFSMYGYLDPSRAIQWLRVTPVRTSIETAPGVVDAVVTIEEVETGRTIMMADSVFAYRPIDANGTRVYAHNFSTLESVVEGLTYRVKATRSDGASSVATVGLPDDEPWIVLRRPISALTLVRRVLVFGVEHVAVLQETWGVPSDCDYPLATYTQYQPLVRKRSSPEDSHEFTLTSPLQGTSLEGPRPCSNMAAAWLEVVASGDPWPYDPLMDRRDLSHPNVATNVTNGVGFIGGVRTHAFHFSGGCGLAVPEDFCDITLDDESATLEGTVRDSCDNEPVIGAAVTLRELAGNRIRSATTGTTGYFRINGLDPGIALRLEVNGTRLLAHESDLELSAGEIRTLPSVVLEWDPTFDPCVFR